MLEPIDHSPGGPSLTKRRKQFYRWQHVPLAVGVMGYLATGAMASRGNSGALLMPISLVSDDFLPMLGPLVCCACASPVFVGITLLSPAFVFAFRLTSQMVYALALAVGIPAALHLPPALLAIIEGSFDGWVLLVWQFCGILTAIGCVLSSAEVAIQSEVWECEKCNYPIRPSVEAGSHHCPECGLRIPDGLFVAHERIRLAERTRRMAQDRFIDT